MQRRGTIPREPLPGLWKFSEEVAWILLEESFGGAERRGRGGGGGGWVGSVCVQCRNLRLYGGAGKKRFILTWQGRYHDHEGGFPRTRLTHCTASVLTPAISPNARNSTAKFVVVGDCVRAFPPQLLLNSRISLCRLLNKRNVTVLYVLLNFFSCFGKIP